MMSDQEIRDIVFSRTQDREILDIVELLIKERDTAREGARLGLPYVEEALASEDNARHQIALVSARTIRTILDEDDDP